jgi:hypothetical protein
MIQSGVTHGSQIELTSLVLDIPEFFSEVYFCKMMVVKIAVACKTKSSIVLKHKTGIFTSSYLFVGIIQI